MHVDNKSIQDVGTLWYAVGLLLEDHDILNIPTCSCWNQSMQNKKTNW